MNLEFLTIPAIIVLCFGVGQLAKVFPINEKYIPVICGFTGTALGAIAYFTGIPFMLEVSSDAMTACAIGMASGFAATGVHQVYKQLANKASDEDGDLGE